MEILFIVTFVAGLVVRYTVWREDQPWQWAWIVRPLLWGALPVAAFSTSGKGVDKNALTLFVMAWATGSAIRWTVNYFGFLKRNKNKDSNRRGVNIKGSQDTTALGENDVARMIKKAGKETHGYLGGVPVPIDVEPLHFLMSGAPGSGKSLAFYQRLVSARQRQHRAIISDPGAEFLKRFWREGDAIFNPFDQRGIDWSPFAEMRQPYDADRIAASMIPIPNDPTKAEWNQYANSILSAVLERLFERDNPTNGDLVYYLTTAPMRELKELVEGSPAQRFFAKLDSGMLASVMNIIVTYIKPYSYLNSAAGKDAFSVRRWIEDDGKDWLFLSFRDDQLQSIRPMIAAVLDVASSAVLSLPASFARRIFFAIDEFATLGLINSIEPLLTKGRKCGAVVMLGVQAISQPRATYGREMTQTLLSCLGTWLVLKQPDADTADYMSKYVGDEEIRRVSSSGNQQGGGWQEQIHRQRAVIPSELQNLNPRVGILNIAGAIPPCWTTIPITKLPDQIEAFQDKEMRPTRSPKPLPVDAGAATQERIPEAAPEQEPETVSSSTAAVATEIQHGDDPFADLIN
ncbi:type IV secretion system DNA-binding domain-containing protein [Sulfuricella sp.]|uniref:type IV secretion system DNA-binding domain-containing protein n=1 Tax=Sulfuricella sp. TaxID=2099377 RepID=UPI002BA103D2|nr:type IV secretion system DNA-binding domain-containing protein [Sulfuricella sp.]HUX64330.1 type IV secretion system DNA-binding domain-containing protein [Sulfuricella sp.]